MNLEEYKLITRFTYEELAKEIGCSRNYLNLVGRGKLKPSKGMAKLIEIATCGDVSEKDLLGSNKEKHK